MLVAPPPTPWNTQQPIDKPAAGRARLDAMRTQPVIPSASQATPFGGLTPQGFGANAEALGLGADPVGAATAGAPGAPDIRNWRGDMSESVYGPPDEYAGLRERAYEETTPPLRGMVDGPGGPAMVGAQMFRDRAVDAERDDYFARQYKALDEQEQASNPQRRGLEAQQLNAAYESLIPQGRPLMGEGGSFQQGTDGVIKNAPPSPRIDRSSMANTLGLESGRANINKDEGKMRSIDTMIDAGAEQSLMELRNDPKYRSASPEQRQFAESIIKDRALKAKTQARMVGLAGNFPSAASGLSGGF